MRKIYLLSLLSLGIAFFLSSCTKEGPEGPVGATGPQGVPGVAGTAGPAGAPGPAGTANVIYSPWFQTTAAGWNDDVAIDYFADFYFDKAAAGVTQAVIDQGIVLGFMKGDPNFTITDPGLMTQVFPLPFSTGHAGGFVDTYDFVLNAPGNIRFLYKTLAPFFTADDLASVSYRYVIIPGGVAGGRVVSGTAAGYTVAQLKSMSYEQVAKLFNIPK